MLNIIIGGVKINKYVVKQIGNNDCASSCMLSILRYYNSDYSKEELSKLINETINGTTAYDIIETAKSLGFSSYAKREKNDIFNVKLPIILHTKYKDRYHFIVLYKIDDKYALIMDPASGFKKISISELFSIFTGVYIVLYPIKELPKFRKDKYKIIKVSKFYKYILLILILTFLIVTFSLILNSFIKYIIDNVLKNISFCIKITLIFLIIAFIKNLFNYLKNKLILKLNYKIEENLLIAFITHLLNISYSFLKIKTTGELLSRINDINIVKDSIIKLLSEVLFNLILIILSLCVAFILDKYIFLLILVFVLINSITSLIFYKIYKNKSKYILENDTYLNSYLTEVFENIESIKNLNITNEINKNIKDIINSNIKNNKKFYNYVNFNTSFKTIINDISYILIIVLLSYLIYIERTTIGNLVFIVLLINIISSSINSFILSLPEFSYSSNAFYRIKELMKYKTVKTGITTYKLTGDIVVKDLNITLNRRDYINMNLNFIIKNNSFTLIKGNNGTGKSTFIKILKKYYETYEGDIFIGENNLKALSIEILNNNILYISQKEKLFNDTIENNIKIFNKNENKYKEIIKLTKVDEIINNTVLKNNYVIEENSFNISGGQRQRIILARALMRKFEYLVLDEALSEVDYNTKIKIITNLKNVYSNKTIIYISHQEDLENLADKIIYF